MNQRDGERQQDLRTSRSLLIRVQQQDAEAWDLLVDLYAPLVYQWCRRQGVKQQDQADVFQEVFIAVARGISRFRQDPERGTFRGWLRTITRSKAIDHFRRQAQRVAPPRGGTEAQLQLVALPDSDEPNGSTGAATEDRASSRHEAEHAETVRRESGAKGSVDDTTLDRDAGGRDEHTLLRRALQRIREQFTERTWRAFWRTAVDGQRPTDIADEMNMSPAAVRVAKSRVLQRLRATLGDLAD